MWNKIQAILNKRNMSINELSVRVYGQKRNMTIYALKNGKIAKPSFDLVCKIADALEVDLNYFKNWKEIFKWMQLDKLNSTVNWF